MLISAPFAKSVQECFRSFSTFYHSPPIQNIFSACAFGCGIWGLYSLVKTRFRQLTTIVPPVFKNISLTTFKIIYLLGDLSYLLAGLMSNPVLFAGRWALLKCGYALTINWSAIKYIRMSSWIIGGPSMALTTYQFLKEPCARHLHTPEQCATPTTRVLHKLSNGVTKIKDLFTCCLSHPKSCKDT